MECLTPTVSSDIIMDNYFTSFRLLTHLGVNNIWVAGVLNKNKLRKCTVIGDKRLQKKKGDHFEQRNARQAKKQLNLCGWLKQQ